MILDGKEVVIKMNGHTYHCALDITMAHIGGKWKTVVLWYLRKEPKRFGELKKLMPEITEKMLSLQLKALEKDGIVGRKVYAEVPARVEYFLTKEGKTLLPVLKALALWGRNRGEKYGRFEEVGKGNKKS
ncbi:MAG: helix-turn-helix transcriptional regulator [Candidatus Moraniibacteriota bacterium]|nr:MAG: helix-turn-helix transcriptional regulator [Candidatus Moranbacteria bacterium]